MSALQSLLWLLFMKASSLNVLIFEVSFTVQLQQNVSQHEKRDIVLTSSATQLFEESNLVNPNSPSDLNSLH